MSFEQCRNCGKQFGTGICFSCKIEDALRNYKPVRYGWICPVCGQGLSPDTVICPCKGYQGYTVTCADKGD